jgi:hypothetical protein
MTTSVKVSDKASSSMRNAYGSLRRGAEIAIEFWRCFRNTYAHLDSFYTKKEWEQMVAAAGTVRRLDEPAFISLCTQFTGIAGNKFDQQKSIEKLALIDAAYCAALKQRKKKGV